MMHPRHSLPAALAAVVLLVLIPAGWLAGPSLSSAEGLAVTDDQLNADDANVKDFMNRKLDAINAAMDAAARDDYRAVERAGFDLIQLSKDAAWSRRADAAYLQDTTDFVQSARFMIRMAKLKDTQGVASSYAAVSGCCLNCHRHARSPKVAITQPLSSERLMEVTHAARSVASSSW